MGTHLEWKILCKQLNECGARCAGGADVAAEPASAHRERPASWIYIGFNFKWHMHTLGADAESVINSLQFPMTSSKRSEHSHRLLALWRTAKSAAWDIGSQFGKWHCIFTLFFWLPRSESYSPMFLRGVCLYISMSCHFQASTLVINLAVLWKRSSRQACDCEILLLSS